MPAVERSVRINGLSPPYTSAQLSTWAFLPTLVLEFLFFASPLLPLAASIPCTVVFFAFAVASSYFGFLATRTNPADPRLQAAASKPDVECDGEGRPSCPWDPNEPTKQCWICDVQVGEKSMHCKFCNKCVDHFDHHCMCKLSKFEVLRFLKKTSLLLSMSRSLFFSIFQGLIHVLARPTILIFFGPWFLSLQCS